MNTPQAPILGHFTAVTHLFHFLGLGTSRAKLGNHSNTLMLERFLHLENFFVVQFDRTGPVVFSNVCYEGGLQKNGLDLTRDVAQTNSLQ